MDIATTSSNELHLSMHFRSAMASHHSRDINTPAYN